MNKTFDKLFSAAVLSLLFVTSACSRPFTDITATSSEDVGPWDVANAKVNAETLTADVCMSDIDAADMVSDRLLLQLRNKGFRNITLAMYSVEGKNGAQRREVTWSPDRGKQLSPASQAGQDPCAERRTAGESSAEQQRPESNPTQKRSE
jgi:hypothetical protein